MRVCGYTRVSTLEQAGSGLGLEAQRATIEAEAARRGWELVRVYEDAGASGRSVSARRGLQEALDAIERGEAQALVVAKLDRLSRSVIDFASLMQRSQRKGWALIAIDVAIDTTTPAGGLVANVMASVAEWERRHDRRADRCRSRRETRAGREARPSPRDQPRQRSRGSRSCIALATGWRRSRTALNDEGVPTPRGGRLAQLRGSQRAIGWLELEAA